MADGRLDPHRSYQIPVVGKKGYGKSRYARWIFDSYPYDRMVVDVTGDVDPAEDWTTVTVLPDRWPSDFDDALVGGRRRRRTLRYIPDASSPSYEDDLDRAVGLAFSHGRSTGHCCLWFEEVHEVAASNRTRPHMRRALRMGRHAGLTLLTTDPRPVTCDPLIIGNADLAVAFRLPIAEDREAWAKRIGWPLNEPIEAFDGQTLDELLANMPKYHYVRYDHDEDELVLMPPLPVPSGPKVDRADSEV